MLFRAAVASTLLLGATSLAAAPAGDAWLRHVEVLAADAMEGRGTGTAGYDRAASYVADNFRQAGVMPAGEDGYWQPVPLVEQQLSLEASALALVQDGEVVPLTVGQDILPGLHVAQLPDAFDAPLLFVGYGLHLPEAGHDDFQGLDLKGKIAVVLSGGPAAISGPLRAHATSTARWQALARAGAIGLITIADPNAMEIFWSRQILLSQASGMRLADPALNAAQQPFFTARFSPERAEILFQRSGHGFAELLELARAGAELPRFDLKLHLAGRVAALERTFSAPNVVGRIAGRDPALKDQTVVLTAHLDHLGIGPEIGGDRIYNGAMDNAAGIASLLELATKLAARPLRRSVLLLAVTGEERGLLGSWYFANRPTVAPGSMVANINMDMYLPLWPLTRVTVLGAGESTLGPASADVARRLGVRQVPDDRPERNLFVRSDQYSFVRMGIPAIAPMFTPATSAQQKLLDGWLRDRYHTPSDDLQQPINPQYAAQFNRYLEQLIRRIGDANSAPQWNPGSYFRRFAPAGAAGAAPDAAP